MKSLNGYIDTDDRYTIRIHPELKDWILSKGGSKFLRKIILIAYRSSEKEDFCPSDEK